MTTTVFPEVMQDMADSAYRQQVYIVAETQMHVAPWLFEEEGWEKSRLKAAIELVCMSKVTQTPEGWHVQGSSREGYDIPGDTLTCPCKAAQHGSKSKICKHRVAVELARRVQQAYPEAVPLHRSPTPDDDDDSLGNGYPVDDETLPLPLPPTSVDERLAAATTACVTNALQEDRMPADDAYIPEPDDAPVAVVEPPVATPAPRPLPGPVLLPSLDARTLEQSMAAWAEQRQVVRRFIQTQLVDGTDYYTLQMGQRASKPTLSKAGSEKFLGLFQLHAIFEQDTATWTMLGEPKGTLCYVCHLLTRAGEVVSEGRGARDVLKEKDINKAIKMAQKSAQIDAVLRTGALSEAFTQDINDDDDPPLPAETSAKPTSADLRKRIWAQVQKMDGTVRTREQVEAFIKERTGMDLHPDFYEAIYNRLHQ